MILASVTKDLNNGSCVKVSETDPMFVRLHLDQRPLAGAV